MESQGREMRCRRVFKEALLIRSTAIISLLASTFLFWEPMRRSSNTYGTPFRVESRSASLGPSRGKLWAPWQFTDSSRQNIMQRMERPLKCGAQQHRGSVRGGLRLRREPGSTFSGDIMNMERFDAFRELRNAAKSQDKRNYESLVTLLRELPDLTAHESAILMKASCEFKEWKKAMQIFDEAISRDSKSTELYNSAIIAQKYSRDYKLALRLFEDISKQKLKPNLVSYNSLITVLSRSGRWGSALRIVNDLVEKRKFRDTPSENEPQYTPEIDEIGQKIVADEVTFNAGIFAAKIGRKGSVAVRLLNDMVSHDLIPNTISFSSVISALRGRNAWMAANDLLRQMKTADVKRNTITYNAVLKTYNQAGLWERALDLIEEMKEDGVRPDIITFNTAISCCVMDGKVDVAMDFIKKIQKQPLRPNTITINSAITVCEKTANLRKALELFDLSKSEGIQRDQITFNAMISTCEKAHDVKRALEYLDMMKKSGIKPDVITYNAVISACQKTGQWKLALQILNSDMPKDNITPTIISYNAAISACAREGQWQMALNLFDKTGEMEENRFKIKQSGSSIHRNIFTYTSAIHAAGFAGKLDIAFKLFMDLHKRLGSKASMSGIIVAYNTIAASCEKKGGQDGAKYAAKVFNVMKEDSSLEPEVYTYATLLNALKNGGGSAEVIEALEASLQKLLESRDTP